MDDILGSVEDEIILRGMNQPCRAQRAAIYARYSRDLRKQASIEDQVEVCRRYAEAQGWRVTEVYSDAALSGASRFRPGFQQLLTNAGHGLLRS